jgi:hypothetical protein
MEAKVQTYNSPYGVCGGQSDIKADFLCEQFGITDFKISSVRTWYNRSVCDHSTSSFSKVLEKIMYKQLQDHLNEHSILVQEQFGFRPDSTTNQAIYKLINETLNALNNKLMVGGIFLILKKLLIV